MSEKGMDLEKYFAETNQSYESGAEYAKQLADRIKPFLDRLPKVKNQGEMDVLAMDMTAALQHDWKTGDENKRSLIHDSLNTMNLNPEQRALVGTVEDNLLQTTKRKSKAA